MNIDRFHRLANFLLAFGLAACGAAQTRTPTLAPPPLASSHTPVPAESVGTATHEAMASPAVTQPSRDYPPRPTATLNTTGPAAANGVYKNPDFGITVKYPSNWIPSDEPNPTQGELEWFDSPDGTIRGLLFTSTPGADLKSTAQALEQSSFGTLKGLALVSDAAFTLTDGRQAWRTVVTAQFSDGSALKASLTTTLAGAQAVTLMVYGSPDQYNRYQNDITRLTSSIAYTGGDLYGIPRDKALVLAGGESANPRNYDPATTSGGSDSLVFTGLVSLNPQLQLIPDLADSWTVDSGTVYTFHLRANAHFHNGRPVTAQDFVYSWERAADPVTNSDTVLTYLGDIVGVRDRREGKADHISGLKVLADDQLQVTIDAPKPYFLLKLTYPTAFVLDKANVESGVDWYRTPNGTGPYRLTRWDKQKEIIYERNEDFYLGPPAIPYVITRLYAGDDLRLYETGDVDMAGIGVYQADRFMQPEEPMRAELHSGVSMCTSYVSLDNQQPPFDDVKVRRAFAMAFDRQKYLDVLSEGKGLPALGLFPPGMPGFNTELKGQPFNPDAARQLLADSKYGGSAGLPLVTFTDGGYGSDVGAGTAALVEMWQQTLGVKIRVENIEPDRYYDEVFAGRHGQITFDGWCADYPDPENFADVLFHTGSTQNQSHYSNPQVDALLEQARVETDAAKRIQLYQQAEQAVVDDAPVVFVSHGTSYTLVKPYVKGYVFTPIGIPLLRYLSLDPSLMK